MTPLAWTATAIITALAGAAEAGVSALGLAFIGVIGVVLVVVIAAFGILVEPRD